MRRIMFVLVFGVSLGLFSQVNPDTLPEKYVKKVIIEAKWGDGPGEFQFGPLSENNGFISSIAVDIRGYFYIADYYRNRVNIFDQEGRFLRFIDLPRNKVSCLGTMGVTNKYLYIFCIDSLGNPAIVEINLTTGNISNICSFEDFFGYPLFYSDMQGNLFIIIMEVRGKGNPSQIIGNTVISIKDIKSQKRINLQTLYTIGKSFYVDKKYININLPTKGGKISIAIDKLPYRWLPRIISSIKNNIIGVWNGWDVVYLKNNKEILKINIMPTFFDKEGYGRIYQECFNIIAFDTSLNCYQLLGSNSGLKVIKYIINQEVWK